MNRFLHSIRLSLTPLSPIHIGCGEDFEPTNYVIDEGVLFHFDPARAPLSDGDRNALRSAANKKGDEAIRELQRFFYSRKSAFAAVAHNVVAVASGIAEKYENRIGRVAQRESHGNVVINELTIERTAHLHDGTPYVPGSSIKGAIRTAWLNGLNEGRPKQEDEKAQAVEKRLLNSGAGFHTDPFRLLRIGDAVGNHLESRIVFSTNHKKAQPVVRPGQSETKQELAVRREVIEAGQYRALTTELSLIDLHGIPRSNKVPDATKRIPDFRTLARACNRFYLPRLEEQIKLLDTRRLAAPEWIKGMQQLIAQLRPRLDAGEIMLLRIGRHSGAESVTLDGIRWIYIKGKKGQQGRSSSSGGTTIWLAADRDNDRSGMRPFGWLLLEPSDIQPTPALQSWCASQPRANLEAIRDRLAEARRHAAEEADRQARLEEERRAQEQEEAALRAKREAELAAMSPEERQIAEFAQACEARLHTKRKDPCTPGSGLYGQAILLARTALSADTPWSPELRARLADAISEWLPKVVEKLDRKDEWKAARKRLEISRLKGE